MESASFDRFTERGAVAVSRETTLAVRLPDRVRCESRLASSVESPSLTIGPLAFEVPTRRVRLLVRHVGSSPERSVGSPCRSRDWWLPVPTLTAGIPYLAVDGMTDQLAAGRVID